MSNPPIPSAPIPDHDDGEPDAEMIDDDGERTLDPTLDDDLLDSADADRLASGGDAEDPLL